MRPVLPAAAALLLIAGCAKSVVPEYDARKSAALGTPTEVPEGWQGDGVLVFSRAFTDELLQAGLAESGAFKRKMSLGERAHFTPDLALTKLDVGPSGTCPTCVRIDASLDGTCSWRIGRSTGERPLSGNMVFDAELTAVRDPDQGDDAWIVSLVPRTVTSADLELGGASFRTIQKFAASTIDDWALQHVFDQVEPIRISRFDAELPLRAIRPAPSKDGGLALELLSEAPQVDLVERPALRPGEDWALSISQTALTHVARKAAFEEGALAYNVAVEPTDLDIDNGVFTLDVRLWKITGRGWWRDVQVKGTWALTANGLDFQAVEAEETGRSKGARLTDPLAALAESRILHAVEAAVTTTLPGGHTSKIGGLDVKAEVLRVRRSRVGKSLDIGGIAALGDAPLVKPKPRSKPGVETGKPRPGGSSGNR